VPSRTRLECRTLLAHEPEHNSKLFHRIPARRTADASLDVANAASAHTGALG